MNKDKLRPIYYELQGYLSAIQAPKQIFDSTHNARIWEQFNKAVDILSKEAGEDFSRFKISPRHSEHSGQYVEINEYRQIASGLISFLHGKYYSDEPSPLSGVPQTLIQQSQQQVQSVIMILEMQSILDRNIPLHSPDSKEHGFLTKLKSALPSITNIGSLLLQIMQLAKDYELGIEDIIKFFKV